jgi:hypothetical protein
MYADKRAHSFSLCHLNLQGFGVVLALTKSKDSSQCALLCGHSKPVKDSRNFSPCRQAFWIYTVSSLSAYDFRFLQSVKRFTAASLPSQGEWTPPRQPNPIMS